MKSFVFILLLIVAGAPESTVSTADVCLSPEERKLYDLMMAYRKSKGLEPIPLSAKLTLVAQTHAHDLSENYIFDPDRNKCNPHSWSTKGKWTACCYTNDHKKASCMWAKPGEIAAYPSHGYEIAYFSSLGATAKEGLDGWKVSPGHNPLIINSDIWAKVKWQAVGIGIYKEYGLVWFGEAADTTALKVCE